jgi:hypothetical protein
MQANNWLNTWNKTTNANGSTTYTPPNQPLPQSEHRETKPIAKPEVYKEHTELIIKPNVSKEFIEYYGTPEFYTPETKLSANYTKIVNQQYDSGLKAQVRNVHIGTVKGKEAWADGFMLEIKPVPEKLKTVKGYREMAIDTQGKPRDFTNLVPDFGIDGVEVKPILKTAPDKSSSSNIPKVFLANANIVKGAEQKYITADPKYIEYFLKNYPDATFIMKTKSSPIIVKSNGEDVGAIMPIHSTDAEFNDYLRVTGLAQ